MSTGPCFSHLTERCPFASQAAAGALLLCLVLVSSLSARTVESRALPAIDSSVRAAVVDSLAGAIASTYVLEEPADRIAAGLRQNLAEGNYDGICDPSELARRLEEDALAIHHDEHFRITAMPPLDPATEAAMRVEDPEDEARGLRRDLALNYGFKRVELLPGGVGCVRFDRFCEGREAFEAATAAMNFVANSSVVILDLRRNNGGSPAMIRFLAGYFFERNTHLINWDIRALDKTVQSYSADHVPGRKLLDQPVYILTSGRTFSAAEEFAFDLSNLGRATIVGETTRGGGNTVAMGVFDFDGFRMGVHLPFGRAYDPETNEGWEGVGITPHIEVPADQALDVAYADALNKLIEAEEDEQYRRSLEWPLADIGSPSTPVRLSEQDLRAFVGEYGSGRVYLKGDSLFYQRGDRPVLALEPMEDDLFRAVDVDYLRVGFERDEGGTVAGLVSYFNDGSQEESDRVTD